MSLGSSWETGECKHLCVLGELLLRGATQIMVLGLPRCCAVMETRTRQGWAGTNPAPIPEVQDAWDFGGNCFLLAQEAAWCCLSCGLSCAVKKAILDWFGFSQGQINLLGKTLILVGGRWR